MMKNHYSWEESNASKPWYYRAWFLVPVAVILLTCILGFLGYGYLYYKYADQIESFDLSKLEKMEAASVIYDRNGIQIGKIFILNRHPIPASEIPQSMVKAIIAEEDNHFYDHHGVDYWGIIRAAISNYRQGRIKQGASTVTQQLARNSFDLRERSIKRKVIEMFLAQRIEDTLSKEKIMELYLNRVYFGSGFYGVEAASVGYFGKPAKELTTSESAMLAGVLKSPNALSPWNNPEGAKNVRDFVLTRMHDLGFLNSKKLAAAKEAELGVQKRRNPFKISYAIDLVRQQAIAALGFERAMNGGVRIDTTFDSKMQQVAEASLSAQLDKTEHSTDYHHETYEQYREKYSALEKASASGRPVNFPSTTYLQGAVLAIDNQTGGILALVGGRDFIHNEYNRAIQGRRPPGTLFAPFVAAAAYSKGIFPGRIVDDSCLDNHYVMIGGETGILGEWGVERADNQYEGPMPSHEAVARGKNAAVVRLGFMTGTESLKQLCSKAGIDAPIRDVASSYLGSSEMGLDDLTLAFSIFPNGGSRPDSLHTINKITDADGQVLFETKVNHVDVIAPEVAYQVHAVLDDALHKTDSLEIKENGLGNFPSGGKSGTAYNFTDVWVAGYSSAVTCGVWLGYDKPEKIFRGAFGKNLALPIWCKVMNASLEDSKSFEPHSFVPPKTLHPLEICRASGLLLTPQCGATNSVTEYGTAKEIPEIACDVHGSGVTVYAEDSEESEWPKAVAAVDLTKIKPIIVTAPALITDDTASSSSSPQSFLKSDGSIPVARAIPLNQSTTNTVLNQQGSVQSSEPEIRRAEAVRPTDIPTGAPVLSIPAPKPVDFQGQ